MAQRARMDAGEHDGLVIAVALACRMGKAAQTECIALQPKGPYLVTSKNISGVEPL